jgi:cytosine/adenosine deaminase-related metal-dependent hydrolase
MAARWRRRRGRGAGQFRRSHRCRAYRGGAGAGCPSARWAGAPGRGERALARVPPGAAWPHPGQHVHELAQEIYDLAGRLDPDRYLALATAVYAELLVAGWTCVGEFHYLHHAPGGPTAMADALRAAAVRAGIRFTLLDTCYLTGGFGQPLAREQARFGDATVAAWADRLGAHPADTATSRSGAAIHSVRAVPREVLPEVVAAAGTRPLHVHLAEQASEVAGCRAAYGVSPARLLHDSGVLGPQTTAVHAIHLDDTDIRLLRPGRGLTCTCSTPRPRCTLHTAPACR